MREQLAQQYEDETFGFGEGDVPEELLEVNQIQGFKKLTANFKIMLVLSFIS